MVFGLEKLDGKIVAMSPIHHGGDEKTGAESMLRRNKVVVGDDIIEVPYISGNAIRGILRRLLMADFLKQIGYGLKSLRLYHALFTGGVLETVDIKDAGVINLDLKRQIVKYVPPLRLFGMSYANQMIEGKLHMGFMLPICKELNSYLPEGYEGTRNVFDFLDFQHQTRKDDLKAERKKGDQAIQMLVNYEIFIAGTPFYHSMKVEDADEIDKGVMARAVELWKQKPYIGGKSSIGLGEVSIQYKQEWDSKPYLNFCKEHKEDTIEILEALDK